MANYLSTNFGGFGSPTDFFETVTGLVGFDTAAYASKLGWPNGGGRALVLNQIANANIHTAVKTVPAQATYHIHCRVAKSAAVASSLVRVLETGTIHVNVAWNADGTFTLSRAGTTQIGPASTAYDQTVSHHLCLSVTVADSGGLAVLYVDGVEAINFSGDTRNGGAAGVINQIHFQGNGNLIVYVGDVFVNDTSGSVNTGFDGAIRIAMGRPSANGPSGVAFTPSAGANWQNVDDPIGLHDGDGTFNETSTPGAIDWLSYPSSDFAGMSGTVKNASLAHWARATDGGAHSTRGKVKKGGSTINGASHALTSNYARVQDSFPVDPSTSTPWASFAAITSAEWAYEMVS